MKDAQTRLFPSVGSKSATVDARNVPLGLPLPSPLPRYRAGTLFVRISVDQICDLSTFEQLTATGALLSMPGTVQKASHA